MVIKAKRLTSVKEKYLGLIGLEKVYPVTFETRFGVHTFGMKVPIDVIILDKNSTVVKIKENLKPNRIFFWNPRYKVVLELPKGTIKTLGIKIWEEVVLG